MEASANASDVDGPREAFPVVLLKLDLDDDREDRLAVDEEHDEIRAILRGHDIGEVSGLDAGLRVGGELDVERVAKELTLVRRHGAVCRAVQDKEWRCRRRDVGDRIRGLHGRGTAGERAPEEERRTRGRLVVLRRRTGREVRP